MENNGGEEKVKKNTYYPETQKRYNADKKVIGCKMTKDRLAIVEEHYKKRGFKSANSYLLSLIDDDLRK